MLIFRDDTFTDGDTDGKSPFSASSSTPASASASASAVLGRDVLCKKSGTYLDFRFFPGGVSVGGRSQLHSPLRIFLRPSNDTPPGGSSFHFFSAPVPAHSLPLHSPAAPLPTPAEASHALLNLLPPPSLFSTSSLPPNAYHPTTPASCDQGLNIRSLSLNSPTDDNKRQLLSHLKGRKRH